MNQLELQKAECEAAILTLIRDDSQDYFFVRGVLENLIAKIERQLEATDEA